MEGVNLFSGGAADLGAAREAAPEVQQEVDAILARVPRGCRQNAAWAVPLLLSTARSGGITHLRRIAYVLATAGHGSHFGATLSEPPADTRRDGVDGAFERYEPRTPLGAALGNVHPGDGERYCGRGFVWVRGRTSYAAWSKRLEMPDQILDGVALPYFVAHPDVLASPAVAAQTLVRGMRDGIFTGLALGSYVNDKKTDYVRARRVVDGSRHAREVAELAAAFAVAIEDVHAERHHLRMHAATSRGAGAGGDLAGEIRAAVERLGRRGEIMASPHEVVEWNGEARQGKFVQLDELTCALHIGRGTYVRLDIQRDLNGVVPPEGRNMALKRSGEVQPAVRSADANFWR